MMVVTDAQAGVFQGGGSFVEYGHFNKHLIFDTRKKDRAVKNILNILKLFLLLEELQPHCVYKIALIKKS